MRSSTSSVYIQYPQGYFQRVHLGKRDDHVKNKVIAAVTMAFGMRPGEIFKNNRHRELVDARRIAMKLLRMRTHLTLKRIGELFGRDHTSVIHALESFEDLISRDEEFRDKYNFIIKQL